MLQTIEYLMNGNDQILGYYQTAKKRWQQIYDEADLSTERPLAGRLFSEQMWFETNCGGRNIGQEIMVITSIAGLYSVSGGFGDNLRKARIVILAFDKSSCSLEVKADAEKMKYYYRGLAE